MSFEVRLAQMLSLCHAGFATNALQPPPLADQSVSDQPRALPSRASDVPPTAMTCDDDAGHCAPAPASPAPNTNGTPIAYEASLSPENSFKL